MREGHQGGEGPDGRGEEEGRGPDPEEVGRLCHRPRRRLLRDAAEEHSPDPDRHAHRHTDHRRAAGAVADAGRAEPGPELHVGPAVRPGGVGSS
ncbi:hypothetical protein SBRY_50696 [Actinacidiphila bryophytorum]|uniref:Uncharacterized protein n=1 Tax=Actinacidiphila bryophytorum TaxID=1436133 RepID=A0A9W4MIR8_9ACTN|nr:hypothetical protein SBRY_50696 [Actinacidiphila bryophytorum]